MSIYATIWELQFPFFGQTHTGCDWEHVIAQGVPEHIAEDGEADYISFLPLRAGSIAGGLRAVVIVRKQLSKLYEAISVALRGSRSPDRHGQLSSAGIVVIPSMCTTS